MVVTIVDPLLWLGSCWDYFEALSYYMAASRKLPWEKFKITEAKQIVEAAWLAVLADWLAGWLCWLAGCADMSHFHMSTCHISTCPQKLTLSKCWILAKLHLG